MSYPHLLSPIRVGAHLLRNRVVMGSMHTRLEYLDDSMRREIAFYVERARGGVAMIVTAGHAPSEDGAMEEGSHVLASEEAALAHRPITDAVHAHGAKMLLQILHAGGYARVARAVSPSGVRSPINPVTPRALDGAEVERTIDDFVRCAQFARAGGYDGVEIMGSEGYLITQFTSLRTNRRDDDWGGSIENRCRFGVEIVRRTRAALGPDFLISFRISAVDLVEGGLSGDEIDHLARAVESAGADMLNTGIGWHESRVPTIAFHVPRGAFRYAVARLKRAVSIPVTASNRINTPELADEIIASGEADLVSMARPLLADPHFMRKAAAGRAADINTCTACNQACLDHIFSGQAATCLVNPKAAREIEFDETPPATRRRVAVVGAGPGGLACAIAAAERGHAVDLYEAGPEVGGQINLARRIPGKYEFAELQRYFRRQLQRLDVAVHLNTEAGADLLARGRFDHIVVATGIVPRKPDIEGIGHPKVVSYIDVVMRRVKAGQRVAVIGTGGIGFDVAELLLELDVADLLIDEFEPQTAEEFFNEWGVDPAIAAPGGLRAPLLPKSPRSVILMQRATSRPGARLGTSTGWILREKLKRRHLRTLTGVTYRRIDDAGLHYSVDGAERLLEVDTIIVCAGQEPSQRLARELRETGLTFDVIGGARLASELDAARAIDEGTRLAYRF
jgi:2,4-dienoyl-CoA reductase (NADPH2)